MSFRYKTIIGVAVIEAFMLGLLVWNALSILTYSNEKELIKRARTTTELFALSNKDAVLSDDLATLESFVIEVLKHPGIVYVRIRDRNHTVLAQRGDEEALAQPFKMDSNYSDVKDGIFDAGSAIEISDMIYGWVEIGFSVDEINSIIAVAKRKSMTFAGIEMVLTAVFSFILGIYLTRSINHLRTGVQKISSGELGYQIEVKGNDELAEAAAAFNEMSQKLVKSENHLKASLKEKELLLKEIHHRAKNNMQVISSLLNMQIPFIEDQHSTEVLIESRNIINSMSLVHEKLYQSGDLANIDFRDYIQSLTNELFESYGASRYTTTLVLDIDNIKFPIDIAIPCGLVINEIISNSLKHAFPDNRKGEISISIKKMPNDMYDISVRDNGIGLPEGLDVRNTKSMGLQLIFNLTEHQLGGKVDLSRNNGTELHIIFKGPAYKNRIDGPVVDQ